MLDGVRDMLFTQWVALVWGRLYGKHPDFDIIWVLCFVCFCFARHILVGRL